MIAPQARGLEVPDAAGISAFMEQIQRNLHLFGRYGITMFAISGLDIALWDLAAAKGVPLRRLIGETKRTRIPAYASLLRIGKPELVASECETALRQGYQRDQTARDHGARGICRAAGDRRRRSADGRHELPDGRRRRDRVRACLPGGRADVSRGAGVAAGGFCDTCRGPSQRRAQHRGGRECLHGPPIPPNDEGGRREPCAALGDQGRRHHRVSESRRAGRRAGRPARAALALFRARACWRRCS